ncbi:MAG: hypothetical protein U0T36_05845 [Saprospiraceae bacterium]
MPLMSFLGTVTTNEGRYSGTVFSLMMVLTLSVGISALVSMPSTLKLVSLIVFS